MSGLFSRLAQQHITQRSSSITPAPSPVFPVLLGEQNAGVIDRHQDQILPQRKLEPDAQIKITDKSLKDNPDSSVSNSPTGNGPDAGRQKDHTVIPQSLTPVIKSVIKAGGTDEEVTPLSTVTPSSTPEARSSIQHEEVTPLSTVTPSSTPEVQSSIQPQLPGKKYLSPTPSVSDGDKENSSSKVEESELSSGNDVVPKPSFNSQQVRPSGVSNRNVQSTEIITHRKHDETQATINVSIGKIEIRATQAEILEKKAPTSSNRTRSIALEEYHQKRVRGER